MKARFVTEQQPVRIVESDKYDYVFLCLNGEEKSEDYQTSDENENTKIETQNYIEYDYTELTINKSNPEYDIDDIKANPQNYIDINDELYVLKNKKIAESKEKLSKYLETHPLFSKAKYEEGRYYNVTAEKQRQLTSKMAMYNIYNQQSLSYGLLKWNDTGSVCEEWTIEELTQLSMEIDAYVTPLVSKQQKYESNIRAAETTEEIEKMIFILD